MAKWSKKLYIGENAALHEKIIREAVDKSLFYPDAYLITLSTNESEQLDIIKTTQLLYWGIEKRLPMVVGIAITKAEALELVRTMAMDVYEMTKECNLRKYFEE